MNTDTFSKFVDQYIDPEKPWHIPPLKENIFAQLYRKDGSMVVKPENVLKCEHLKIDFIRWCERNRIPYRDVPVKLSNINPEKDTWRDKYTKLQVLKLNRIWEEQLRIFNYEF